MMAYIEKSDQSKNKQIIKTPLESKWIYQGFRIPNEHTKINYILYTNDDKVET